MHDDTRLGWAWGIAVVALGFLLLGWTTGRFGVATALQTSVMVLLTLSLFLFASVSGHVIQLTAE